MLGIFTVPDDAYVTIYSPNVIVFGESIGQRSYTAKATKHFVMIKGEMHRLFVECDNNVPFDTIWVPDTTHNTIQSLFKPK